MAAEKGNNYAEGNEGGRPTLYKEEYNDQAYKLCLLGATDKELADFFEVSESTINNWKQEHQEFLESIRKGKKISDMEVVHSLYQTTQDRTVIEQQAFKCKEVYYNDEGKRIESEKIEIVDVEKVIPADFRSQQFWLKNRKSDSWRDKTEVENTNKISFETSNLSDEEKEQLFEISLKLKPSDK
jgi:hypothetical protein